MGVCGNSLTEEAGIGNRDLIPGYSDIPAEIRVISGDAFIDLPLSLLAGVTIFSLKGTCQNVVLACDPVEVGIGKFAPPGPGLTSHLFPFTF